MQRRRMLQALTVNLYGVVPSPTWFNQASCWSRFAWAALAQLSCACCKTVTEMSRVVVDQP